MPWIRLDCSVLDDDFLLSLTPAEGWAWMKFLLRAKALGARGIVPITSTTALSLQWKIPKRDIDSMLVKAKGKIGRDGRNWIVRNWARYQDYHKSTFLQKGEIPGDVESDKSVTTPPHPTGTLQEKDIHEVHTKWNAFCERYGLSKVINLTAKRRRWIVSRLREPEFVLDVIFAKISQSAFLLGKKGKWRVSFDFVFKNADNYLKILEGQYDGTDLQGSQAHRRGYSFQPEKYSTLRRQTKPTE